MRFYIDVLYYMIIKFIKLIIKFEIKIFIIVYVMNFEKKLLKLFFYSMLKFSFFFL